MSRSVGRTVSDDCQPLDWGVTILVNIIKSPRCILPVMDVLITDDSGFMRDLLREILEEDHNVVGEAENGVEAVELYQEHEPDIVFMDIVMPIKDGIEATGEITNIDPDAKVVMCTSVEQAEQMKESIKAGAEGYITKPFQKESVLEELNSIAAE